MTAFSTLGHTRVNSPMWLSPWEPGGQGFAHLQPGQPHVPWSHLLLCGSSCHLWLCGCCRPTTTLIHLGMFFSLTVASNKQEPHFFSGLDPDLGTCRG
jgi:hypothetical protein